MKRVMKKTLVLIIFLLSFGTSWGQTTFWVDSLEYSVISDNTVSVCGYEQGITNAVIPETITPFSPYDNTTYDVTAIGDAAFDFCESLKSVTIENGVTTIGNFAFRDCGYLTSVTIGNGVATIGEGAFDGCVALTSVTMGNGVNIIGEAAFYSCYNLKHVICLAEEPPAFSGNYVFEDTPINKALEVPCKALEDYQKSSWANYFPTINCDEQSSLNAVAGQETEISVYPNPIEANGNAVINLQGLSEKAKLTLIHAHGRIIVSEDLNTAIVFATSYCSIVCE